MRRPFAPYILGILGLSALLGGVGCQQQAAANPAGSLEMVAVGQSLPAAASTATVTPIPPPPTIIVTATPEFKPPSFAVVDPNELANAKIIGETAVPDKAGSTATGSTATGSTATAVPPDTATPQPTFTPPALPYTSHEEHYWLQRPIAEGGTVWTDKTYPYGSTRGGSLRPHHGVEFYVPNGTPVLAAASGTVVVAGNDSVFAYGPHTNFYGNLVVIQLDSTLNGQPVYILHGHLSQLLVAEGQRVNVLEPIALSGATGIADGPHLHFEVRLGQNSYGSTRNPLLWLYPFPDYGAVAGRVTRQNGSLVEEAPISLRRLDAPSRYLATTSYAGTTVNPDDQWLENFAFDDVPAGYYEITVGSGKTKVTQEMWVFPYRTNFVEIKIED
ncbi:MAG: peptidoglycan DD-metalloendopeptidase family protein [Chloroflexi bacterium]|nr:peptidoglycan DD-metalloendopeptidase family protein [Chloroflexota bacterium]